MEDQRLAMKLAAMTILAMAAAYGVVCGTMMFAGELEGGTLTFLDIFEGGNSRLWLGKAAVGVVLAVTQALTVALALWLLRQQVPRWVTMVVGRSLPNQGFIAGQADPNFWFIVLPVLTVEAYAWGLLGSSLTNRVLAGAAGAAVGISLVMVLTLCARRKRC